MNIYYHRKRLKGNDRGILNVVANMIISEEHTSKLIVTLFGALKTCTFLQIISLLSSIITQSKVLIIGRKKSDKQQHR